MDAQTQEKLKRIENDFRLIDEDSEFVEDFGFLLQLVREQETQLTKYERVVEAAKEVYFHAYELIENDTHGHVPAEYLDVLSKALEELE